MAGIRHNLSDLSYGCAKSQGCANLCQYTVIGYFESSSLKIFPWKLPHKLTTSFLGNGQTRGYRFLKLNFMKPELLKLVFDMFWLRLIFIQTKIYIVIYLQKQFDPPQDPHQHVADDENIGTSKVFEAGVQDDTSP